MLHTHPFESSQFFFMALQSAPSQLPLHQHLRVRTLHEKPRPPVDGPVDGPVLGAVCATVTKATRATPKTATASASTRIFVSSMSIVVAARPKRSCVHRGVAGAVGSGPGTGRVRFLGGGGGVVDANCSQFPVRPLHMYQRPPE
jgi:hypothetical protein